jgi:hypothetical protein
MILVLAAKWEYQESNGGWFPMMEDAGNILDAEFKRRQSGIFCMPISKYSGKDDGTCWRYDFDAMTQSRMHKGIENVCTRRIRRIYVQIE